MAGAKLGSWVLGTDTLGTRVIPPFVQQPGARVFTGGVERSAGTVSVVREIAATTPASLGTPGGVMAGTVTAALTEPDDVHTRKRSPWDRVGGWPPADGDLIDVDATLDGETWGRRFTGVIEGAAGAAQDIEVPVDGVDAIDRLNRPIEIEPIATPMPVQSGSITPAIVDPLLRHEHYVEATLRRAGWYLGPQPASGLVLHAPLVGSLLDTGAGTDRLKETPEVGVGRWGKAPWGPGWQRTTRGTARAAWRVNVPENDNEIAFMVAHAYESAANTQRTYITFGANLTVSEVKATQTRLTVTMFRTTAASSVRVEADVPWPPGNFASVRLIRKQSRSEVWINGTLAGSSNFPASRDFTAQSVELHGQVSWTPPLIGHLLVGRAGETVDEDKPVNARLMLGDTLDGRLAAGRYIKSTVIEVLRDLAQATNAAAWIDNQGHFVWAHPDALTRQDPVATLTADADVLDLAWRHRHNDLYHTVRVSSQKPTITTSARADVEWWSGKGDTINADQKNLWWERLTIKEIAAPPSGTDWMEAKLGPYWMRDTTESRDDFALGESDWYGATTYYGEDGHVVDSYEGVVIGATSRITSQAYEATTTIDLSPGSQEAVSSRIPTWFFHKSNYPSMVPYNGTPLPILRGFGKVEWTAGPSNSGHVTGPITAADYSHDPGWWVQGADSLRLADWIASQVTVSRPLIEDLPVVPRHDLELGNVITIEEHAVYGVTIKALIIGIREQYSHGEAAMTLTLRVLEATGGN